MRAFACTRAHECARACQGQGIIIDLRAHAISVQRTSLIETMYRYNFVGDLMCACGCRPHGCWLQIAQLILLACVVRVYSHNKTHAARRVCQHTRLGHDDPSWGSWGNSAQCNGQSLTGGFEPRVHQCQCTPPPVCATCEPISVVWRCTVGCPPNGYGYCKNYTHTHTRTQRRRRMLTHHHGHSIECVKNGPSK